MKVVAFFQLKEIRFAISDTDLAAMRDEMPDVEIVQVDDEASLAREIADAEAFVGWHFPRAAFGAARRLRWIQTALAGVEDVLFPELVESGVILTNGTGLHSTSIPEHTLALVFALARNLHQAARLQAEHRWGRFEVIMHAGGIREISGSRLAILGAGPIGAALARRAQALGMSVRVLRRRPGVAVEGAEAVVGPGALHELLGWADFVVLALPLTPETTGLIDASAIEAMRSSAILINIARGEIVDDAALVDALRRGRIAGAGLDAFREEPLPPESPYWELGNVIITPHVSGYAVDYFPRLIELFRDNLRRWTGGRPLRNVVDKRLGYVVA